MVTGESTSTTHKKKYCQLDPINNNRCTAKNTYTEELRGTAVELMCKVMKKYASA